MNTRTIAVILAIILLFIIAITMLSGSPSESVPVPKETQKYDNFVNVKDNKPQTVKINESKSANWISYTNSEHGFSFRYPQGLTETNPDLTNTPYNTEPWQHIVSFSGKEGYARVDVFLYNESLTNYSHDNKLGGVIYCFGETENDWLNCNDPENKQPRQSYEKGPELVLGAEQETYAYITTEEGWSDSDIIVPIENKSKVIVFKVYNWNEGYVTKKTTEYVDVNSLASSVNLGR